MTDTFGVQPAEVALELPTGDRVSLIGDAADASIIGTLARTGGQYEPELMAVLPTLVAPAAVCLDVGANVGAITLALSRLCPAGHVHAFEPAEASIRFLRLNLVRNGASNVTAHRIGLSDSVGQAKLHYNRAFAGGAFISNRLHEGVEEVVTLSTLDAWVEEARLSRLDLVKLDVEGSELPVLQGACDTIARFKPILVAELNPVMSRRVGQCSPRVLFSYLRSLYGPGGHLALISSTGSMVPVWTWGHMRRALAEYGVCDLICSPRRLLPGLTPGVAGPRSVAATLLRALRTYGRFSTPPWAAVVEPQVKIDVDPGMTRLTARPQSELHVPLRIENRGDVAIIGHASRFPVSVRVIWIDEQGHHEVDERSRVAAPTVRQGRAAGVQLPLFVPSKTGRYVARIALLQEHIAWFHDLDSDSYRDLEVVVAPAG